MGNETFAAETPDHLTVVANRRIKPGHEAAFEQAMRSFVEFTLSAPGHRGIIVLRPAPGSRDYTVVDQFSDERARHEFKSSAEYQDWMRRLGELTEGDLRIEELSGLEGWFTLPEQASLATPPKYKMAVATFLGVFPVAMTLNLSLAPAIRSWPFLLSNAVFNAGMVTLLTWVVMPLVTRALRAWLFPQRA
jgi:antibiotic biosynthesis monooxygenase (ABM) superfamily enzyme